MKASASAARIARPDLEKLLGNIPYLNGGLFDVHELEKPERYGKDIQIPDKAFERVFDYFDQYQWHLDERPLRADNEINPDVLGYIFEKYINGIQPGDKVKGLTTPRRTLPNTSARAPFSLSCLTPPAPNARWRLKIPMARPFGIYFAKS